MNTDEHRWIGVYLWSIRGLFWGVALPRKPYLVVFALVVALLAVGGLYLRQQAKAAAKAAAECDSPAPPPKPTTPPPKLPDFQVEPACGPGEAKPPDRKK
jgi:hypothetical protein